MTAPALIEVAADPFAAMRATTLNQHVKAISDHLQTIIEADAGLEPSVSGVLQHVAGILLLMKEAKGAQLAAYEAQLAAYEQRNHDIDMALTLFRQLKYDRDSWIEMWLENAGTAGGVH